MLKLLKEQEFFFFSDNTIDFDGGMTAMFETEEKEYDKSIIIEVRVNRITTKLQ